MGIPNRSRPIEFVPNMLKLALRKPLTVHVVTDELGVSKTAAQTWLQELWDAGIFNRRPVPWTRPGSLRPQYEYWPASCFGGLK